MIIEKYFDISCPWCWVGKAYLSEAIEQSHVKGIEIVYHSFMLNPDMPPEGVPYRQYYESQGKGYLLNPETSPLVHIAREHGLKFNFGLIDVFPNTSRAHQLVKLAPASMQADIIEELFRTHFTDGADIYDLDTLGSIAAQFGLDGDEIAKLIESEAMLDLVLSDVRTAGNLGINSVPTFILDQKYLLNGAYPPDQIAESIMQCACIMPEYDDEDHHQPFVF